MRKVHELEDYQPFLFQSAKIHLVLQWHHEMASRTDKMELTSVDSLVGEFFPSMISLRDRAAEWDEKRQYHALVHEILQAGATPGRKDGATRPIKMKSGDEFVHEQLQLFLEDVGLWSQKDIIALNRIVVDDNRHLKATISTFFRRGDRYMISEWRVGSERKYVQLSPLHENGANNRTEKTN